MSQKGAKENQEAVLATEEQEVSVDIRELWDYKILQSRLRREVGKTEKQENTESQEKA